MKHHEKHMKEDIMKHAKKKKKHDSVKHSKEDLQKAHEHMHKHAR